MPVTESENILGKRLSRREFVKKAVLAAAGLGLGTYTLSKLFSRGPAAAERVLNKTAPDKLWKWSKEAYHYSQLGGGVRCGLCPNQCIVEEGYRGFCRNRVNKGGRLYTIAYGNPCSVHVDPIEKKPLYHFLPTSTSFSIATGGCNFRCLNCQNWSISQYPPDELNNYDLMPEKVVQAAVNNKCATISYTYSEPSTFYEYMYDTARLAVEQGVRGVWVTNGYMNTEPLKQLCTVIHGANVDLKAFDEGIYNRLTSGSLQPVLNTLKTLKGEGVWFEVTNLVVPSWTDDLDMIREMSKWLYKNIGPDHPLHFSRFHPAYKLTNLPATPVDFLDAAWKVARDEGLNYVYVGNIPGTDKQNTYCPKCGYRIIERRGYIITVNDVYSGYCRHCGQEIAGVWK
jgi:pyruvate formate lyase activating enzyme